MLRCKECDAEFGTSGKLTQHIRRVHDMTAETYYRKYALDNIEPICSCGCGQSVTRFYDLKVGFSSAIFGHQNLPKLVVRKIVPVIDVNEATITCSLCGDKFAYEARFNKHLNKIHTVTIDNHYVNINMSGTYPTCGCGCGEKLKFYGWFKGFQTKFVKNHNHPVQNVESIQKGIATRKEGFAEGRYKVWNGGLTKENDARIVQMSERARTTKRVGYASGRLIPWQKGKTKTTSEGIVRSVEARRRRFEAGEYVPWNSGMTKTSSPRLAAIGKSVSKAFSRREIGRRISIEDLLTRASVFNEQFELINPDDYRKFKETKLQFKCRTCMSIVEKSLYMLETTPVCFTCHPKSSFAQLQILEFVRGLGLDAIDCDRSVIAPKEIDIYVPSHRFGIEYNGLYWHSEKFISSPVAHQDKHTLAISRNVNLFSVFEDEWRDKRHIIEGMFRHRLGLDVKRVDARKCDVVELTRQQRVSFFDENHLDGDVNARFAIGLIERSSGILVAATSFRRPFHRAHSGSLELARSAALVGHNVRGWLGKLMASKILRDRMRTEAKDTIISYVDGRIGQGNAYRLAGFTLLNASTGPRFWWTDFVHRYDRFRFRATHDKTQRQVAEEAGVVAIHGCSNSLWQYKVT